MILELSGCYKILLENIGLTELKDMPKSNQDLYEAILAGNSSKVKFICEKLLQIMV